jgi:redox-sensitive bicupin YhaK (pirin superfamily)
VISPSDLWVTNMSFLPAAEPDCSELDSPAIELVIAARPRDLDTLTVRRVLPSMKRRMVGPFIFFDHMGPAEFADGQGVDVRPHPHIALATVTYLFDGEIVHRDHLGFTQPIRPGDVNWMIAGRGIVHSERTAPERRVRGERLHGIQSWVALPLPEEERPPSFEHHPAPTLPLIREPGLELCVVAGTAYGKSAPVTVLSPTLYVAATLDAGTTLTVPDEHPERAAYVAEGAVLCDGQEHAMGTMLTFRAGVVVKLTARTAARVMLLGGAPLDGPRHIYWNFVSSSKERIERAKNDWKEERFPKIPGDDQEFIPLPDY